ncbi:MAG: hypothetical protein ACE5JU_24320 [Candidatus Binatia bacterium]
MEFLDIAHQFQASSSEAERRTSIGRSYYALYNVLIGLLSSQGVPFENGGGDHWRLVNYLTKCNDRIAFRIGGALRDLRSVRTDADYHLNMPIEIAQSELAYKRARRAINRFDALQQSSHIHVVVQLIKQVKPFPPFRSP